MRLYPELPRARARHMMTDLLILLLLVLSLSVAARVHESVAELADPAIAVEGTANRLADDLAGPVDIPLVGDVLRAPLDVMAGVSTQVGAVAGSQVEATMRAAGVARGLTLLPAAILLILRVRHRIRWSVAAGHAIRARATASGMAVLALRAAVAAPLPHVLAALPPSGGVLEADQVRPLAAIELARIGLRLPGGVAPSTRARSA